MKITVVGTGYVGLVTAACLAEKGHKVICMDTDKYKIDLLKKGISPIYEKDMDKLIRRNKERLVFTQDWKLAYKDPEVIIVGVGTPEKKDGSANLVYVFNVVKQIAEKIMNDCVVAIKSTVPIGTNEKAEKIIKKYNNNKYKIDIVSNPEFLSQGTAINDTFNAARIVIGTESKRAENVMLKIYEKFSVPIICTNRRSAEMIKYASNNFLALKISYINEIANLCEKVGANIEDVAKGIGMDPRIGNKFLKAGIGYGGSCFPKDTKALHALSNFYDYELKTVKAAIEVNDQQKLVLIKKARKYYSSFEGLTIAVLGLTFKPGTDDLREAPSLVNIPIFLEDGAKVKVWDPVGINNFKKIYPTEIEYCKSIDQTLMETDICFIFTDWDDIKQYNTSNFKKFMKRPIVLDGRNCYAIQSTEELVYEGVGY